MSLKRATTERWLHLTASDGSPLPIRVVDVAGARHLRLSLGRNGPRLSKPRWVALRDAQAFVEEKRGWLERHLSAREESNDLVELPALTPGATGHLPLRGGRLSLRIASSARPALDHQGSELTLRLPDREPARLQRLAAGQFRALLEQEMQHDCQKLLAQHVSTLGRAPVRLRLRPLRSLWGSLSAADHMSLDLALILMPPALLEYVLVHELCHLFERNHGPRFWAHVAEVLPDYKQRQRQLRECGESYKHALSVLLATAVEPAPIDRGGPFTVD